MDEIDEVTIEIQNLNDHPSLYNTNNLGSEDPMTKLLPRLNTCLDYIMPEHSVTPFESLRRYCSRVQLQPLYRPKYEYVVTGL